MTLVAIEVPATRQPDEPDRRREDEEHTQDKSVPIEERAGTPRGPGPQPADAGR